MADVPDAPTPSHSADGEGEEVTFGRMLEIMSSRGPQLAELLSKSDKRRARMIFFVMTSETALDAFEELIGMASAQVIWADATPDQPTVRLLARRVLNDIEDAIDALLNLSAHGVLNACRDLMELTVLMRDFRKSPQRLTKWLKSDENVRRREFGFGKLLGLYPGDEMNYLAGDFTDVMTEFTVHSRTLHPALPTTNEEELSHDAQDDADGSSWVQSFTFEILKHGMGAVWQLMSWLIEVGDRDVELPDSALPLSDSAIDRHAQKNRELHDLFPPEIVSQLDAWYEQYQYRRTPPAPRDDSKPGT